MEYDIMEPKHDDDCKKTDSALKLWRGSQTLTINAQALNMNKKPVNQPTNQQSALLCYLPYAE